MRDRIQDLLQEEQGSASCWSLLAKETRTDAEKGNLRAEVRVKRGSSPGQPWTGNLVFSFCRSLQHTGCVQATSLSPWTTFSKRSLRCYKRPFGDGAEVWSSLTKPELLVSQLVKV